MCGSWNQIRFIKCSDVIRCRLFKILMNVTAAKCPLWSYVDWLQHILSGSKQTRLKGTETQSSDLVPNPEAQQVVHFAVCRIVGFIVSYVTLLWRLLCPLSVGGAELWLWGLIRSRVWTHTWATLSSSCITATLAEQLPPPVYYSMRAPGFSLLLTLCFTATTSNLSKLLNPPKRQEKPGGRREEQEGWKLRRSN